MSTTINFIDTKIKSLQPSSKRQIYWCNGCPGFGIRITPSGSKSFIFKYMSCRKSRWMTIGKFPQWSIRKARQEYDRLYEQVYDYGLDPVQDEKERLLKASAKETVKSFTKIYFDLERIKGKKFIKEEERYFTRDIWPVLGDMQLDEVTPDDVDQIQINIMERAKNSKRSTRGGKSAVKHAVGCTRRLFNLAIKKGKCDKNPVDGIEPLGETGKRNRVLSFEEIWRFWNGLDNSSIPPVTICALKFILVSMQRGIEIRNMRYESHKTTENVWQMEMHETKNKTMHRVPINNYALALIEQAYPFTNASPYIFGATRAHKTPKTPCPNLLPLGKWALSQALLRSRPILGIEDVTPHDLRRTGATWITAVGLPKLYARLMLNHSDGDRDVTSEVYVQYSYDFEKRRAIDVWGFILNQIIHCENIEDIPTLDEMRERAREAGLV